MNEASSFRSAQARASVARAPIRGHRFLLRVLATILLAVVVAAAALAAEPAADSTAPPAVSPPRSFTAEDYTRFRQVGDPRISPDGAWVAYTVRTMDLAADRSQSDLWMTSWDGATTLRLTTTAKDSEHDPRWSPDGRFLAFLSDRGEEDDPEQLWLLPRAGGEAERVSDVKGDVDDFAWSPDGTRFALVMADTDSVALAKDATPRPIVIDRFYFKEDETGYVTRKYKHLYLIDLATRKAERLTRGNNDDVEPAWSPDGKSIAFLSKRGPNADRTSAWEVHVVEARPGADARPLTRFEGRLNNYDAEDRIAWSPDGAWIAFLQCGPPELLYYAVNHLAVVPAAGGPVRVLTAGLDRWVSHPRWAPDSRSVYVVLEEDRAEHLARVPLEGGAPETVVGGKIRVTDYDVSPTGRIAVRLGTTATLAEVFAVDGPETRPLSRQNDALLAGLRLAPIEEIGFRSRDGTEIHGYMVKPPDFREGTRYPTILRIHGGPVGQFAPEIDLLYDPCWQALAGRGYVVLAVNPRGSTGRGEKFAAAIRADWGNKDAQDVIAAVDYAVARGIADPGRLGVGGWSYGGMLTNYVIAQDRRFKAATSGASISNILAGYGTDMYPREYEAELGTPWTKPQAYLRLSTPFLHADRIVTPTLFLCGEKDFNVPLLDSEQMYQALRSLGRDTQLVIYPGQYHVIEKPSYIVDRAKRYLDWYDRHLK